MRVRSVTPKPGFVFDGREVIPASGNVVPIGDSLRNAVIGTGTGRDARSAYHHHATALTQHDIDQAYRGSGLLRKIIKIPADDMVREWRDWKLEADDISKVEAEEKRHTIRQKIRQAEVLRGLGGGALILGLPGDPAMPAPRTVGVNGLAYVHVVSRWHLRFDELQDDARIPGYGEPKMWRMSAKGGEVTLHPSRVIPFRADTSAALAMVMQSNGEDQFWGESKVAQVLDAVTDSDAARASFAALMHKARLTRIGIPGLSEIVSTPGGETRIAARLSVIALAEGIHNAAVFDAGTANGPGESITDVTYNFTGAKDILNTYAEFVAAISDIPATRLLGRAPEGMNSSGDSQQKDYAKKIGAMQELDLTPCLDRLDAYLIPSALGSVPDGAWYEFAPLDAPTEKEIAERAKLVGDLAKVIGDLNVMPERAFNRAVQSWLIDDGVFPELEMALAEIPEAERWGIEAELDLESGKEAIQPSAGPGGDDPQDNPPVRAANDAKPRPIYVRRDLLNATDLIAWAKAQGIETTLPTADMHVTVLYSKAAVDPIAMGENWSSERNGGLIVKAGGPRALELFSGGALVLQFAASDLIWRHKAMIEAGASHDFPEYLPHVTIAYTAPDGFDLDAVKPFTGELRFGPEIFEPLDLDWNSKITEA